MIVEQLSEDRLSQLKALLVILAEAIDARPGARDLAQLSRQYRETLKEVEALEEAQNEAHDEIGDVLAARAAGGRPGVIRVGRYVAANLFDE